MAYGRKRILGGAMMVAAGCVLAAAVVSSRWHFVVYSSPKLQLGIGCGVFAFEYGKSEWRLFTSGFHHGVLESEKRVLCWWDISGPGGGFRPARFGITWSPAAARRVHLEFLIWPASLLALMVGAATWRMGVVAKRRRKDRMNACPACRYSRAGLGEAAACPECGRAAGGRGALASVSGR